tara:strand:- start:582 stop:1436 length:855 start_codon:yes stop_codon:yes gene_type:complete
VKKILIFALLFLTTNSFALGVEKKLEKNFYKTENKISKETDSSTYESLGLGYLNGYIFADAKNGFRYYASIPKDITKAKLYLSKAADQGSDLSNALLGIIYRKEATEEKDIDKAIQYLSKTKDKYYDVLGEYGLALHQKFRWGSIDSLDKSYSEEMIMSLNGAALKGYIPAINALHQLYKEGSFVTKDLKVSEIFRKEALRLAEKKVNDQQLLSEAMEDSKRRLEGYSSLTRNELKKGRRISFLISLGIVAAVSYSYALQDPSFMCTVGCQPPSVVDLMNWGIL